MVLVIEVSPLLLKAKVDRFIRVRINDTFRLRLLALYFS